MSNDELNLMRREMDRLTQERLVHLEERLEDLDEKVMREIAGLEGRVLERLTRSEKAMANEAAVIAVRQAFCHLGVDVDKPSELQQFRDDLRFGGVFRNAVTRGFFAILAAVAGGIGLSVWLAFKERLGIP